MRFHEIHGQVAQALVTKRHLIYGLGGLTALVVLIFYRIMISAIIGASLSFARGPSDGLPGGTLGSPVELLSVVVCCLLSVICRLSSVVVVVVVVCCFCRRRRRRRRRRRCCCCCCGCGCGGFRRRRRRFCRFCRHYGVIFNK